MRHLWKWLRRQNLRHDMLGVEVRVEQRMPTLWMAFYDDRKYGASFFFQGTSPERAVRNLSETLRKSIARDWRAFSEGIGGEAYWRTLEENPRIRPVPVGIGQVQLSDEAMAELAKFVKQPESLKKVEE